VARTIATFGHRDVLVADAVVAPTKPLLQFTEPDLDRVGAVNLKSLV
jgi:NAD(P)-dependent dehydrogenase (short-subunit alcohol dehydrogenase family)